MDQRTQFSADCQRALTSIAELCTRFVISRKTGYKWIDRYEAEGPAGWSRTGIVAGLRRIQVGR